MIPLQVQHEKHILFDVPNARQGELTGFVDGPSGRVPLTIDSLGQGKCTVRFTPNEEGKHHIYVNRNGKPLPKSPYLGYATVERANVDTKAKSRTNHRRHQRTLDVRDHQLKSTGLPHPGYSARAERPVVPGTKIFPNISHQNGQSPPKTALNNGQHSRLKTAGNMSDVGLTHGDDPTAKYVPARTLVTAGNFSKSAVTHSKVVLKGKGVKHAELGEPATFSIDGRQAGPGEPEANVYCGRPNCSIDVQIEEVSPKLYNCSYTTRVPGTVLLNIKWNGYLLRCCPISIDVCGTGAAAKDTVSIESPRRELHIPKRSNSTKPSQIDAADEIAIVGVGCRFPGADNLEEFWRVLVNGENHVKEVDNDRWDFASFYDPDVNMAGKSYVNKAGLVANIDAWDNQLFGINDIEAGSMDPQQSILLECCHMAMEDGGFTRKQLDGSNTSVFVGAMNDDYNATEPELKTEAAGYIVTGIFRSILSARLSYIFNLKGPCMVVDTACSSSLTAVHLARQSLLLKESDLAIAGGVSVLLDPKPFVNLSKAHMLSPTGQCHTFTSDADGYARGEGCGVVLLQRLSDALAQGNKVWGTLRTGTNQDGHMISPITAPSEVQQHDLLERMYIGHDEDKHSVQVIEAHGTGTSIGDPTEVSALGSFFKDSNTAKRSKIKIGSVKTNIGHLESAAGMAGLTKVLLMMKNEKIAPTLMYSEKKRNPRLDFKRNNMVVPTKPLSWPTGGSQTRTACVNSFGFGGSNTHALIKQWSPIEEVGRNRAYSSAIPHLVVLSSAQKEGLIKNVLAFGLDLDTSPERIEDISMTSLLRRDHFKFRVAFVTSSKTELQEKCRQVVSRVESSHQHSSPKIVYVFCGVGTTWSGMCTDLLKNSLFRKIVKSVDKELQQYTGWSIVEKWENRANVSEPLLAHLSIFVCQLGVAGMWRTMGIRPDAVVGQSVGEVAACYIAGALDLNTAVKLIYERSHELSLCSRGGMIVVRNVSPTVVEEYCRKIRSINIAVYISHKACTVSGAHEGLTQLEQILKEKEDVKIHQLDVPCGYHSHSVNGAGCALERKMYGQLKKGDMASDVQIISTVHGKEIGQDEFLKETYWKQNVVEPVKFYNSILEAKGTNKNTIYIEIGPSPVLKAHMSNIFGNDPTCNAISSIERNKEYSTVLHSIGAVYEMGGNVDFTSLFDNSTPWKPSTIPKYVFNKKVFPVKKKVRNDHTSVNEGHTKSTHPFIFTDPDSDVENSMRIKITPDTAPFVYDHVVRGAVVVPGAIYADVGFEIGRQLLGLPIDELSVSYDIFASVTIASRKELELDIRIQKFGDGNETGFRFGVKWEASVVCTGVVKRDDNPQKPTTVDLSSISLLLPRRVTSDEIYTALEGVGYQYGKWLRVLQCGVAGSTSCIFEVSLPKEIWNVLDQCHIHPSILDGMLQSWHVDFETFLVPIGMDSISIRPELHTLSKDSKIHVFVEMFSNITLDTMRKLHLNIYLIEGYKNVIAKVENFVLYGGIGHTKGCDDLRYTIAWTPHNKGFVKEAVTPDDFGRTVVVNASGELMSILQNVREGKMEFITLGSEATENNTDLIRTLSASEHVILFVDPNVIPDLESSTSVMDAVSNSIRIIQNVIQYIKSDTVGSGPDLFLVTKGIHAPHYPDKYKSSISVLGSEVWGLYQNFVLEFFYTKVTLVDIASCEHSTITTLLGLMATVRDNGIHGREFCIYDRHVLGLEIRSNTKRHRVPSLRRNTNSSRGNVSQQLTLRSRGKHDIQDPFFMYENNKATQLTEVENDFELQLELNTICVHDSNIYPATKLDVMNRYGLIESNLKESGYPVMAIEITGRLLGAQEFNEKATHKDELTYVACYPCISHSIVKIPEECCIKQSILPNYRPGLLITAVILWELLEKVENGCELHVSHSKLPAHVLRLLHSILKEKNIECTVVKGTLLAKTTTTSTLKTALVLQRPDLSSAYNIFQQFTHVLCLPDCLPESIIKELRFTHGIQVTIFDATTAFANKRIRSTMTKIKTLLVELDTPINVKQLPRGPEASLFGMPLKTIAMTNAPEFVSNAKPINTLMVEKGNLFDRLSTYIVVGGLTGVGWLIVELLAEIGAGVIVTFGRRQPTEEKIQEIISLQHKFSCRIEHMGVDVTEVDQVRQAIRSLEAKYTERPIKGIFQGAGINISSTLSEVTASHIEDVMKPKVKGTINLHLATAHLSLDYFVLLSSISAIFGAFGQITYGAANSFQDAFANHRRRHGMVAQSINWGGIQTGMTQVGNVANIMETRGHFLLKAEEFRSCFVHSLLMNETNVIYANINKDSMRKIFGIGEMASPGKKLVFLWENDFLTGRGSTSSEAYSFIADWVKGDCEEKQMDLVRRTVTQMCSSVLSGGVEDLADDTSFMEMGIDSMSSIALSNIIRNNFDVDVDLDSLFDPAMTIHRLSQVVFEGISLRKKSEN